VIEKVEAYHVEGRTDREKTDEFIHWIYDDKKEATALRRVLIKDPHWKDPGKVSVRETAADPWWMGGSKKKEGEE
jgi:hypothetical protein